MAPTVSLAHRIPRGAETRLLNLAKHTGVAVKRRPRRCRPLVIWR